MNCADSQRVVLKFPAWRYSALFFALALCCFVLAACGETAPVPSSVPPTVAATPAPGTGNVSGILMDNGKQSPLKDTTLYLAELKKTTDGKFTVAALDPVNAPRAYTNVSGEFAFVNVAPAEYLLAAGSPRGQVFLKDPSSNQEILVVVKDSQVINLGNVFFDMSQFQ